MASFSSSGTKRTIVPAKLLTVPTRGCARSGAMPMENSWLIIVALLFVGTVVDICVRGLLWRRTGTAEGGTGGDAPNGWRRVLLVIAHPDDETMFFGPTIQALSRARVETHLVCLSNGDADGLGEERTKELEAVGATLGLRSVEVVSDPRVRDGFEERWPEEAIASHVDVAAKRVNADVVLTFDSKGVSGHPNHVATYRGVLFWLLNWVGRAGAASPPPRVWALVSINPLRKYFGFINRAFALFETHALVKASDPAELVRAMRLHASQWVWYRKLFMRFSQFSYVNSLCEISTG